MYNKSTVINLECFLCSGGKEILNCFIGLSELILQNVEL